MAVSRPVINPMNVRELVDTSKVSEDEIRKQYDDDQRNKVVTGAQRLRYISGNDQYIQTEKNRQYYFGGNIDSSRLKSLGF